MKAQMNNREGGTEPSFLIGSEYIRQRDSGALWRFFGPLRELQGGYPYFFEGGSMDRTQKRSITHKVNHSSLDKVYKQVLSEILDHKPGGARPYPIT